MRVAFVQFGDFRGDLRRLRETGVETRHSQRASMAFVEELPQRMEFVGVVSVSPETEYAITDDASGLAITGLQLFRPGRSAAYRRLFATLERYSPTHVVARFPDRKVLSWCLRRGLAVLPNLADSFDFKGSSGWRAAPALWRRRRLAKLLNDPRIPFVSNHNVGAAESLARLGVSAEKIVPWDWRREHHPRDFAPRSLRAAPPFKLLHVGAVSEAKGVGDLIRAIAGNEKLRRRATLTIVGDGDLEAMRALARERGVADLVALRGPVPFHDVAPKMRDHDALIIYTRHAYGEGIPGVVYQGLATRTPLILSDHPVFQSYFAASDGVAMARERDPAALAGAINDLLDDRARYEALSRDAEATFDRIALDTYWEEHIERWLNDAPEDREWLRARTLSALRAR